MSLLPRRFLALAVSLLVAVPLAQAHPGHDGDHGLTWDFSPIVAHPFATLGCLLVLAAAGWGAGQLGRSDRGLRMAAIRRKDPSGEA